MTLSTTALRNAWAPACKLQDRTVIDLHGAGRISVDGRCAPAFRALNACLIAWNYLTRKADTGAYNCRKITGGSGYSLHAYGIAADLNWLTNPYGRKLITDMPAAMVAAILSIRTNNGKQVFRWGGFYSTNKDGMHWEVVCTPADLATGIDPATLPAAKPSGGFPLKVYRKGAKHPDVIAIKYGLNLLRKLTGRGQLPVTDVYDDLTASVVGSFQKFARGMQVLAGETDEADLIDVDNVWGPQTGNAANFWGAVK